MHQQSKSGGVFWGIVFILLGLLFITQHLHAGDLVGFIFDYWPILLVAWGVWFVLKGIRESHEGSDDSNREAGAVMPDVQGRVQQHATFGDIRLNMEGSSFKGGEARTIFGSIKVYATELRLPPGEHTLSLNVSLGDIRVDLPADLPVKVTAQVSLGDIKVFGKKQSGFGQQMTYNTPNYESAAAKIHLQCQVGLGDIKIF